MHTSEIQALIDAAHAAGGGTVSIPAGIHPCSTLFLRDHVTLHLMHGAVIQGIPDPSLYHDTRAERSPYRHFHFWRALILARNCRDCGITGPGTIDGQGHLFDGELSTESEPPRPKLVWFDGCSQVHVADVRLHASAAWTLHLSRCDEVRVERIHLRAHANINNDGIDIDSCRDVVVRDCDIDAEDDAICLKTLHEDPCQDIRISGCRLRSRCYGVRCGTESMADFRNITVSDCVIWGCDRPALGIHLHDGGSVENMVCSNLVMDQIDIALHVQADDQDILVLGKHPRFYKDGQSPTPPRRGTVRGLVVRGVIARCTPGPAVFIESHGSDPMTGIVLSDWRLSSEGRVPPREITATTYRSRGSVRKQGPPAQPYLLEADPKWGKNGWFWAQRLCAKMGLASLPDAAILTNGAVELRVHGLTHDGPGRQAALGAALDGSAVTGW